MQNISGESFYNEVIDNNYKIICYGYGVIGKITAPQFLKDMMLEDRILLWVDGDKNKQGRYDDPRIGEIRVADPSEIHRCTENFVILITGSRYEKILKYIEEQGGLKSVKRYVLPYMLERLSCCNSRIDVVKTSSKAIIPKKIHYCWFGGNPVPLKMQKCIDSWTKMCPDYEIIQWNEENYDVNKYTYTRQAYEAGKWAFVSDVARLDILYEHGGIYLDTDVELIRNLDGMLYQQGFCGIEKWRIINSGGGCGAVQGNEMVGRMLESRTRLPFINEDGTFQLESSGSYETLPFISAGYIPNNSLQIIEDMTIYPAEVFHPYDYMTGKCHITENTYSVHHFFASWI